MKIFVAIAILAALISPPALADSGRVPTIEQGIYTPDPPFENTKQFFYVRERERPLLTAIVDADTSIALFLLDVTNAVSAKSMGAIRSILPEARGQLRLPPLATFDQSTRYVASSVYCWTSEVQDQLAFFIDWADVVTNARYTDSYIFVRHEASWYFKSHGSTAPRQWAQTQRYFQRACPISGS